MKEKVSEKLIKSFVSFSMSIGMFFLMYHCLDISKTEILSKITIIEWLFISFFLRLCHNHSK